MKQQIAGFLGELAEELGWAPELDEARVRPEITRPERPKSQLSPRRTLTTFVVCLRPSTGCVASSTSFARR